MKKRTTFLSLLVLIACVCQAQMNTDTLRIKKGFSGYQFIQGDKKMTFGEATKLMEQNGQAYKFIKSAKASYTWASIFGGIGGAFIGWPVGEAIAGKDAHWYLAGIGAGIIGASIPFSINTDKKAKAAVNLYNNSMRREVTHQRTQLHLSLRANTVGLAVRW